MKEQYSKQNHRLQDLTLNAFHKICRKHDVKIADHDLKIILRIMKDNPYLVFDKRHNQILFVEISLMTSEDVSEAFRPIIMENHLINEF